MAKSVGKKILNYVGDLGKALMFPIAVLPIAAILLRVGAEIPTATTFSKFVQQFVITGGSIVFDNLPILFAVGIAFGLSKDNRGEAAFAGLIGMLLLMALLKQGGANLVDVFYGNIQFKGAAAKGFGGLLGNKYDAIMSANVLNGILAGILVSVIYNNSRSVELPKVLGFFSGRRLVPVLAIFSILILSFVWALVFPWIAYVIYIVSKALGDATGNRYANAGIMGVYGILNRLLIPFGLHHIPNNIFWFQLGHHLTADGKDVFGDIFIFLNGVPEGNTAGTFQSGFFPVMMFGLPAMVAAFYVTADDKEQKRRVIELFGSAAVVSFLTGITEPIEFAFLFVSPLLYGIHALLTGLFGFIVGLFGIQIGFGFSAGLFDYLLSFPKSLAIIDANYTGFEAVIRHPLWLLPIGAVTATVYYFLTWFMIKKLNLATPGRGAGRIESEEDTQVEQATAGGFSQKAKFIVKGFGGWDNIVDYQNCSTRLRYTLKDGSKIDETLLKKGGVIGVKRVSDTYVHAVVGVHVENVNNEIKSHIGEPLD
ncbi:PTS transporter subunit EIIC [Mycoplasmopsis equigenitalium]|uniref:PTS transporter subunit EIIC n=1 Tax=Mycoplasmopsis equigenitalium TaxID=114883 RepID=A0ABY5J1F0_9BACT|nr:PTS transporter subunit EIIC [Mycoplasmopsis equigenitalium]UUD37039.1 PTS transporter subunit EIIC [Mycoplasmopsis equigenitalium]